MAYTVYILLNSQLEYLKAQINQRDARIKELEDDLQQEQDEHKKDLRLWAGINRGAVGVEEDTRRFISEENRKRLAEEYERKHGRLEHGDIGGAG
jgi:hypothetical protein